MIVLSFFILWQLDGCVQDFGGGFWWCFGIIIEEEVSVRGLGFVAWGKVGDERCGNFVEFCLL